MTKNMNHELMMRRAFQLAMRGRGKVSPNPMVGCVIVKDGQILSEGWHKKAGGDHAEIDALKKIEMRAQGASMYVTLEPCAHFGRTPPCVDQVKSSGIKEIFIGTRDPDSRTHGKSIQILKRAGIKVFEGILKNELSELNEIFFKYITQKMPFVAAKCAQTLDGKIATAAGQSKWITSEKSRLYGRELRGQYDAILVGIETVLKDNPQLNPSNKMKRLKKIIIDSHLRIPVGARLFQGMKPEDVIIATTSQAIPKKINALKNQADIIICPAKKNRVDFRWLFKEIAKKEISSVFIEGGGQTIGSALNEELVDKMYIFMAPQIVGDENAVSSVSGRTVKNIGQLIRLEKTNFKQIDCDFLIEGYVYRNH